MDYSPLLLDKLDLKYSIRDPVHGFIHFNELEKSLIDHPWFQRLRHIKQLAFTDFVYPGATHTRFEHSIGVMHLASKMFLRVVANCKPELVEALNFDENEKDDFEKELIRAVQLLRLAALLHDIGHGPFSHAAEAVYPWRNVNDHTEGRFEHEDYSVAAILRLKQGIESKNINLKLYDGEVIRAAEVASLLQKGDHLEASTKFYPLTKTIISSQLDADRMDYLLRDSLHAGVTYGIYDLERLLESLSFCMVQPMSKAEDVPRPEPKLAIWADDWQAAESLIIARHRMFTMVYLHKTRRVFDLMLTEALLKKFPDGFPPPEKDGLVKYFAITDATVIDWLHKKRQHVMLLSKAIRVRTMPRLAGTLPEDRINEFTLDPDIVGRCVTDKQLAQGGKFAGFSIWIDTGAEFTTYKDDTTAKIKLRAKKPLGQAGTDPIQRFAPLGDRKMRQLLKLQDFLKEREVRVYCNEDSRKAVSAIIKNCGGEPCLL